MKTEKKDNLRSKILDRYFEVVEETEEKVEPMVEADTTVDYRTSPELSVETATVNDQISVVKKPTVISSETVIHGNINADNDLEISGQVIGDIVVQGMVKVMEGSITGNIKATKVFIKDSSIDGNIESESMIDIIDNSEVIGNITGGDIVINSKCKGNIVAGECLKLLANAVLRGDLQTKRIKIDEGAIVEGNLKML